MRSTLGSPLALVAAAYLFHAHSAQAQVLAEAGALYAVPETLDRGV